MGPKRAITVQEQDQILITNIRDVGAAPASCKTLWMGSVNKSPNLHTHVPAATRLCSGIMTACVSSEHSLIVLARWLGSAWKSVGWNIRTSACTLLRSTGGSRHASARDSLCYVSWPFTRAFCHWGCFSRQPEATRATREGQVGGCCDALHPRQLSLRCKAQKLSITC